MEKPLDKMSWDEQVDWFVWNVVRSIVSGKDSLRTTIFWCMNSLHAVWHEKWEKENKTKIL